MLVKNIIFGDDAPLEICFEEFSFFYSTLFVYNIKYSEILWSTEYKNKENVVLYCQKIIKKNVEVLMINNNIIIIHDSICFLFINVSNHNYLLPKLNFSEGDFYYINNLIGNNIENYKIINNHKRKITFSISNGNSIIIGCYFEYINGNNKYCFNDFSLNKKLLSSLKIVSIKTTLKFIYCITFDDNSMLYIYNTSVLKMYSNSFNDFSFLICMSQITIKSFFDKDGFLIYKIYLKG